MKRVERRAIAFVAVMSLTAFSLLGAAEAQVRKPTPLATPPKKPAVKPAAGGGAKPLAPDAEDAGALATTRDGAPPAAGARSTPEERPPAGAGKDAGTGGGVVESKTLDGGTRVFRFGEVEVEGRLKSPQIVYFLRRVRAEFAAGDLGHRSFVRELSETRNEPGF